MIKKIWGTLAGITFLLLLGTFGNSDLEVISLAQTIRQSGILFIALIVLLKLSGAFEVRN